MFFRLGSLLSISGISHLFLCSHSNFCWFNMVVPPSENLLGTFISWKMSFVLRIIKSMAFFILSSRLVHFLHLLFFLEKFPLISAEIVRWDWKMPCCRQQKKRRIIEACGYGEIRTEWKISHVIEKNPTYIEKIPDISIATIHIGI